MRFRILCIVLMMLAAAGNLLAQDSHEGLQLTPVVMDIASSIDEYASSMAFCHQSDCLISIDENNHISRVDLSQAPTATVTQTTSIPVGVDTVGLDISPDDRYVRLFIPGQGTFVWDIAANEIFNIPNEVAGVDAESSYSFPGSFWHQIGATYNLVLHNFLYNQGEIWTLETRQRVPDINLFPYWLSESRIATYIRDGSVFIWDSESGEQIREIATGNRIETIYVDAAQSRLYVGNYTDADTEDWAIDLTVWDARTGSFLFSFPAIYNPYSVVLSDDGFQVFIGDENGWTVWDTDTQSEVFRLESGMSLDRPEVNQDETLILTNYGPSSSANCSVSNTCEYGSLIWEATNGTLLTTRVSPNSDFPSRWSQWMSNGQWLINSGGAGLTIWEARTGQSVYELNVPDWSWESRWSLNADETKLFVLTQEHLYIWTLPQP